MLIEYKNHKIFAFSDTYGLNDRLDIPKDADILICAGDCMKEDDMVYVDAEYLKFLNWYSHQDAKLKIYVPGNHEVFFIMNPERAVEMIPSSIVLLEDSGVEYDGISFFGAVCRPWMFKGTENKVPKGVDFLITHGPAEGHLDNKTGCQRLWQIIEESKPKHHIFGHVHEEGGKVESTANTIYYNVSACNQLRYKYAVKDNCEYSSWLVKKIEEDIIYSWTYDTSDDGQNKCLLSLRKELINDMVLSHQEDYIEAICDFNDCLKEALKEMYDRASIIYNDVIKHNEYGDEIEVTASLYLGKKYPTLHPIQGGGRQQLWKVLCDSECNVLYENGITTLSLSNAGSNCSFEELTGMDCQSPDRNKGLNPKLIKDMHLLMQFNHLLNHMEFAITDFIFVRDFYSEINVKIEKGVQYEE